MLKRLLLLLAFSIYCIGALAQVPPTPAGGFPVKTIDPVLITYADGYMTHATINVPDPALVGAPSTGWPCVVLIHGMGSNRGGPAAKGRRLTKRGYITIAYDVRGQGSCIPLNSWGGTTLIAGLEKGDLAEVLHKAKAQMGSLLDFTRLGVMGTSQGGVHSWAAAAWSERLMPQPRGSITHFPKIAAVCPGGSTPNFDFATPEGNAFNVRGLRKAIFGAQVMITEPAYSYTMLGIFLAQDFPGVLNMVQGDPWRHDITFLPTCDVPVYTHNSWLDHWFNPNSMVDATALLPATTPRHVHLSTGNHESFDNDLEHEQTDEWSFRWFDQHMRGTVDEFGGRPGFTLTTRAMNPADLFNQASVWKQQQLVSYPNTGLTTPATLYLRSGNLLQTQAPSTSEAPDTINHVVAPGLDPAWYLTVPPDPQTLFAVIPQEDALYRSAPFTADSEILGRCQVSLFVNSAAPNMQINAVLFDEAPGGQERFITGGLRALRGRTPGTDNYSIELGGTNYILPAGHRLVLRIENLTHHRGDNMNEIRTVPYFESYSFDCEHSDVTASSLTIPFRNEVAMSARFDRMTRSLTLGGPINLVMDGGRDRSGHAFYGLISVTGTVPGVQVGANLIPINPDFFTISALNQPNTAPFNNFVGQLDAEGQATATLQIASTLPLTLNGIRIYGAAICVGPGGDLAVSSGSDVQLVF